MDNQTSNADALARQEYREKLRSLGFVSRPMLSKVSVDHTDTAVVTTTEKPESQDVHVKMLDPVRPHWDPIRPHRKEDDS